MTAEARTWATIAVERDGVEYPAGTPIPDLWCSVAGCRRQGAIPIISEGRTEPTQWAGVAVCSVHLPDYVRQETEH